MAAEDRVEAEQLLRRAGKNVTVGPFRELLIAIEQGQTNHVVSHLGLTGIPLSSPLGQSLMRLSSGGGVNAAAVEEIDAPELRPVSTGELLVMGSRFKRCGIREYGDALNKQLTGLGEKVYAVRLQDLQVLRSARGNVLMHIEPSLLPAGFDGELVGAIRRGCRIVMCMHAVFPNLVRRFGDLASALVQHRDYGIDHARLHTIPLGCPVFEPKHSVEDLRDKYGLPRGATVITTFGFMTAWKRFPETAKALLPLMKREMFLQMLCAPHFSRFEAGERQLRAVVRGLPQVQLKLTYLPQDEVNERIYASDLGFVYHAQNTGSVSAAARQFVTSRRPLIATSSSHTSDLTHVSRAPKDGVEEFAKHVVAVAQDKEALASLQQAADNAYQQINMKTVAQKYRDLFESLKGT